jgi:hypothetical protein
LIQKPFSHFKDEERLGVIRYVTTLRNTSSASLPWPTDSAPTESKFGSTNTCKTPKRVGSNGCVPRSRGPRLLHLIERLSPAY